MRALNFDTPDLVLRDGVMRWVCRARPGSQPITFTLMQEDPRRPDAVRLLAFIGVRDPSEVAAWSSGMVTAGHAYFDIAPENLPRLNDWLAQVAGDHA